MARPNRAFPGHVLVGARQALAVPQAAATPPLPKQVVQQRVAGTREGRARTHGAVITSRWPGYQWVGLPPVLPLITPHVQQLVDETAPRRHPGHVTAPRPAALAAPPAGATVTPLTQPHVQQAAPPRLHVRGGVFEPRPAALAVPPAGVVVTPLPKPHVQQAPPPRTHVRGGVLEPRPAALSVTVAAPIVTPPRTITIIQSAAAPRMHRRGQVFAPRVVLGVQLPPPRPSIIRAPVARPKPQRRVGCVLAPRTGVTAPVTPPRPIIARNAAQPYRRRPRGGGVVVNGAVQRVPSAAVSSPPTFRSFVGYVHAGAKAVPT